MAELGLSEEDMIGAIKIKDGLFIGDAFAAKDQEFVVANKVTKIINCAGTQIQNQWNNMDVKYLTFQWLDSESQQLFINPKSKNQGDKDKIINDIFDFIETAENDYESVLVHSVRGQSRASCVIAAYMMKKYKWSLLKTLEFLNSRRPDLEIRATFITQLGEYEKRLRQTGYGPKTSKWDEISEENRYLESEELMLRNTFLNAQNGPVVQLGKPGAFANYPRKRLLKWRDFRGQAGKYGGPRQNLAEMTDPRRDLINLRAVPLQANHRRQGDYDGIIKKSRSLNDISSLYPSMYREPPIKLQKQQISTKPKDSEKPPQAKDRTHTPQGFNKIFHPKKPSGQGDSEMPNGEKIESGVVMDSFDSQRQSASAQQKQINRIPQSNPTANISSIQGRYTGGNSVINTVNTINSTQSNNTSLNVQNNSTQNGISQPQQNNFMAPQQQTAPKSTEIMRKQFTQYEQKQSDQQQYPQQFQQQQQNQQQFQVSSQTPQAQPNPPIQHPQPPQPQYITNIYNTINTNSITTTSDQIHQFVNYNNGQGQQPAPGEDQQQQVPLSQLQPKLNQRVPNQQQPQQQHIRSKNQNADASNLSMIQRELKPNKIVNKGNSVFSNHHNLKIIQGSGRNEPGAPSTATMGSSKSNAHSANRTPNQGSREIRPTLTSVKNVRDSIQSQSSTKGPTIGAKSDIIKIHGDTQVVNSSMVTMPQSNKKATHKIPASKFSKATSSSGSQMIQQPKRGGSARPIQNKQSQNGIIMGSSHGITSQVPPKEVGGSQKISKIKSTRGESPIVKSKELLGNSAQSDGSRKQENHSGQNSTKGSKQIVLLSKNQRGGVQTVGSFGAAMARSTATPQGGPLQMSIMGSGPSINPNLGAPTPGQQSGPQSRHQIGFKAERSNQGFKAGGPIRATGIMMDRSNMIATSGLTGPSNIRSSNTPGALSSSKMPQRPGSSKPLQKGNNLMDGDQRISSKQSVNSSKQRPESPSTQKKQYVPGQSKQLSKIGKMRSSSPNAMIQQQQNLQQMNTSQLQNQQQENQQIATYKLKGKMSAIPGSAGLRQGPQQNLVAQQSGGKISIINQQNYLRGYSPSKPLWK